MKYYKIYKFIAVILLFIFFSPNNSFSIAGMKTFKSSIETNTAPIKAGGNTAIILAAVAGVTLVIAILFWMRGGVDKAVTQAEKKVNSLENKKIDDKTKEDVLKIINKTEEKIKKCKKLDNIKKENLEKRIENIKKSYYKICKTNILINYDGTMLNKINLNDNKPQKRR